MVKIWKNIKNYNGLYKISNIGEVYSFYTNKLLIPQNNIIDCYKKRRNLNSGAKPKSIASLTTGEIFLSIKSAADFFNVSSPSIIQQLNGKSKTCCGQKFIYFTK